MCVVCDMYVRVLFVCECLLCMFALVCVCVCACKCKGVCVCLCVCKCMCLYICVHNHASMRKSVFVWRVIRDRPRENQP